MTVAVAEAVRTASRFKVKFPDVDSLNAALASEGANVDIPVVSHRRAYLAITVPPALAGTSRAAAILDDELEALHREFGAEIVVDRPYDLDWNGDHDAMDLPPFVEDDVGRRRGSEQAVTLDEVLRQIRADACWPSSRGEDVVIAVIDTGVDGSRPEFPSWKRYGHWETAGDTPWTDWLGHGTMCATIAAGCRDEGGSFDGVAPAAKVIACKTRFFDSELVAIYDYLIALKTDQPDLRLVATNSFGVRSGEPPPPPPDTDLADALVEAYDAGIALFFSAGNNHGRAGGLSQGCDPNSIWLHKGRSVLLTVGTCDMEGGMWSYSSRGPGQFYGEDGTDPKPDVVAPTPRNGTILYGSSIRTLALGWGTSGACPQAAGLAALLWAKQPALKPSPIYDAIRNGAVSLGYTATCEGRGRIDCLASLALG